MSEPVIRPKVTLSRWLWRLKNVVVRLLVVLVALAAGRVVWHLFIRDDARALIDGRAEGDLVARRDYLAAHIDEAAHALAPKDTELAGELSIVALAMTALAAANIGFEYSATVPADLELVIRCAELARRKDIRASDVARWGDDPIDAMSGPGGHAGYLGELALVLEAYRLLGGLDGELLALERRVIGALDAKLRRAKTALIETIPGEAFVADNAVVLAALALADVGRGAHASGSATTGKGAHADVLAQTLATWRATVVDASTGVLVLGEKTRVPQAAGAAFAAMMLAYVDDTLAKDQAKALAAHFDTRIFGMFTAICEHPSCAEGGGASPAATGFAMALAKRSSDADRLDRLLATAEWAGLASSWNGKRRYLFGPFINNAIVLAAMSARSWDVRYLGGS
jgi:hypothetical protein